MDKSNYLSDINRSSLFLMISDLFLIFFIGYLIDAIKGSDLFAKGNYQFFLVILAFLTFNIFNAFSVYNTKRGETLGAQLTRITFAWGMVVLSMGALTFVTKTGTGYSRLWAGWTFLTTYGCMILTRVMLYQLIKSQYANGYNRKNIIILGAGTLGKKACDTLLRNDWVGLKPIAFFDDDASIHGLKHKDVEVIDDLSEAIKFIENERKNGERPIEQVWIALPLRAAEKIEALQKQLLDTATKVYLLPDIYGFNLASYRVGEVAGLPIMKMSAAPITGTNALLKRLEDLILSTVLLICFSPIFLIVAVLIKQESPGPVFFKQRRYGQDGREILVWKFRSMSVTEDGDEVKQAQRNDDRITKSGAWLRKLSIDELPQLINVFLGSMSLVGPRPHAVAHNEYYRTKVSGYMTRHQIKPGITGLAQIKGFRGETAKLEDMQERIHFDLEYIRNWTVFLDFKILFLTIPTLLKTENTY